MGFISSGVTAIVTNGVPITLISAIDKIEAYFVFTSEILVEKLFHAGLAVHSLVFTRTAIVAFFVARALDFRHYEKTYSFECSELSYLGIRCSKKNIANRAGLVIKKLLGLNIWPNQNRMKFY